MSYWEEAENDQFAQELAKGTLAYFLSNDTEKQQLTEIFQILASHIRTVVPQDAKRKIFGRTLHGLTAIIDLEAWIERNLTKLRAIEDHEDLLRFLWPVVADGVGNNIFKKCDKPELLIDAAIFWLNGSPFHEIFEYLRTRGAKLTARTQRREIKIDHVVDVCENAFAFDGALAIGAVSDLVAARSDEENDALVQRLNKLHKRFKYGLPFSSSIALYECGFADRIIARDLSSVIGVIPTTRSRVVGLLRENEQEARTILGDYPNYFEVVFANLLA